MRYCLTDSIFSSTMHFHTARMISSPYRHLHRSQALQTSMTTWELLSQTRLRWRCMERLCSRKISVGAQASHLAASEVESLHWVMFPNSHRMGFERRWGQAPRQYMVTASFPICRNLLPTSLVL